MTRSPEFIRYTRALKQCQRVGTSHATGDALRAMYAKLVAQMHGGDAERYYAYLESTAGDRATMEVARALLRDRATAWDVLMGIASRFLDRLAEASPARSNAPTTDDQPQAQPEVPAAGDRGLQGRPGGQVWEHRGCGGDIAQDPGVAPYEYKPEREDGTYGPAQLIPVMRCQRCGEEIGGDSQIRWIGDAAYLEDNQETTGRSGGRED